MLSRDLVLGEVYMLKNQRARLVGNHYDDGHLWFVEEVDEEGDGDLDIRCVESSELEKEK